MKATHIRWLERGGVGMLGLGLLFCGACAGMNHEPESPEEWPQEQPSAAAAPSTAEASAPAADSDVEAEAEPAAASEKNSEPATQQDLEQALQVVIGDDALLSELKLEEPGRFPLKIAGDAVPAGLKLSARTEAVEVVSPGAQEGEQPVLVFTDIDLNAKQGTFKYRYEAEGVRGTTHVFKNSAGVWELKSSRVSGY